MLCFENGGKQEGFIIELESEEPPHEHEDEVEQLGKKLSKL